MVEKHKFSLSWTVKFYILWLLSNFRSIRDIKLFLSWFITLVASIWNDVSACYAWCSRWTISYWWRTGFCSTPLIQRCPFLPQTQDIISFQSPLYLCRHSSSPFSASKQTESMWTLKCDSEVKRFRVSGGKWNSQLRTIYCDQPTPRKLPAQPKGLVMSRFLTLSVAMSLHRKACLLLNLKYSDE